MSDRLPILKLSGDGFHCYVADLDSGLHVAHHDGDGWYAKQFTGEDLEYFIPRYTDAHGVDRGDVPGEVLERFGFVAEDRPEIYDCQTCGSAVYYPDTHEPNCPHQGTRRGKP